MFRAQIAVVFGQDFPAFVFHHVAPPVDPWQPNRRQTPADITDLGWIAPSPACVVDTQGRAILYRDLAKWHLDRRVNFAFNVNTFTGRKRGVEIGGIFELKFGSTHLTLPSSALSESGV